MANPIGAITSPKKPEYENKGAEPPAMPTYKKFDGKSTLFPNGICAKGPNVGAKPHAFLS